ncbi:MAG TPA: hypothetical protein VH740_06870 [Vicinamibacterales bacterium]|jgi:hypothetical protein
MAVKARLTIGAAAVCAAMLTIAGALAAQANDPIVGTWTLNSAKSTYKPGPAPKSATVVVEPAGKGIKVAVDAVNADGTPMKWGYTTMRDGKDVPVTGNPAYDTAATTMTTPSEGTTVYKKGGKTVATSKMSIAADGKTLTINSSGTDPKGQAMNNVIVMNKK